MRGISLVTNGFNQHEDDLGIASHAVLDERVHHKNAALRDDAPRVKIRSGDEKVCWMGLTNQAP